MKRSPGRKTLSISGRPLSPAAISRTVEKAIYAQPVLDIHTHLYPPSFGTPVANRTMELEADGLMLWGIDELLTYHYLIAEVLRVVPAGKPSAKELWKMTKQAQADLIWDNLFINRSPISEACRGVLTTLKKLGLDPAEKSLIRYRKFFSGLDPNRHIDNVMRLANVESLTMTNDPFDDAERARWLNGKLGGDPRFSTVLRLDPMICNWPMAARRMRSWGYHVQEKPDRTTIEEARRFLVEWLARLRGVYIAASLPSRFEYPVAGNDAVTSAGESILTNAILPVCEEKNIPFAAMIGSDRGINPEYRAAGDMGGRGNVRAVTNLCRAFPNNRFLVTMLSRENQHELAVAARKFSNLMIFGCWWFLNNPSLIEEITTMRVELLGTSFIPQHSDARILEQIIYKWDHSRNVIGSVLTDKYMSLARTGWPVTESAIARDIRRYLKQNASDFLTGNR